MGTAMSSMAISESSNKDAYQMKLIAERKSKPEESSDTLLDNSRSIIGE